MTNSFIKKIDNNFFDNFSQNEFTMAQELSFEMKYKLQKTTQALVSIDTLKRGDIILTGNQTIGRVSRVSKNNIWITRLCVINSTWDNGILRHTEFTNDEEYDRSEERLCKIRHVAKLPDEYRFIDKLYSAMFNIYISQDPKYLPVRKYSSRDPMIREIEEEERRHEVLIKRNESNLLWSQRLWEERPFVAEAPPNG